MKPEDKAVVQQLCDALKKASITVDSFSVQRQVNEALDAGKALLEQPAPVQEPSEEAVAKGVMALLQCSYSELDDYSPRLMDAYQDDVKRVFSAMAAHSTPPIVATSLAQPDDHGDILTIAYLDGVHTGKQLAKREWVGLTDEEVVQCQQGDVYHFYRCIEAKLREKNGSGAQPAALVDLTHDEIHALWWADKDHGDEWLNVLSTVRAVLAKLKEKST